MITPPKLPRWHLREAAKVARHDYAMSAETVMTLARAEMGRKLLNQGLSLNFEKPELFDMSSPILPTEIVL